LSSTRATSAFACAISAAALSSTRATSAFILREMYSMGSFRHIYALEEQTIADVCHHPSLILFSPFPFHDGSSFTDKLNSSPRRCPRWRPPYPH
jgi:hypothetical protein